MKVSVLAFASASDLLGREPRSIDLPDAGSLETLRQLLIAEVPGLELLWPRLAIAVDGQLELADLRLHEGAEIALLPPVSGG